MRRPKKKRVVMVEEEPEDDLNDMDHETVQIERSNESPETVINDNTQVSVQAPANKPPDSPGQQARKEAQEMLQEAYADSEYYQQRLRNARSEHTTKIRTV